MPLIKRYSNRKLYDSEKRTYITLEDIAEMIRRDEDVEVVDHESGQDITTSILSQIIYEQEKKIIGLLPQNTFARLIRAGGIRMRSFHESYLAFLDPQLYVENEVKRRLEYLVKAGKLTSEDSSRMKGLLLSPDLSLVDGLDFEVENLTSGDAVSEGEVRSLIGRIEELEKELASLQVDSKTGNDPG